ncbi:hypothetical protein TWF506_010724 [Arthrobotrys conoides]|uniref:Uncharacterized protein n=1 Tax=Arthrobotrys conoides TaxID=74498 RepID=A0AAN8N6V6_9PEZI
MNEQNDVLITSVLYIILSLAGIPLLLLLIWLTCQLYKNQMERVRFRNQLKRMEEGLAAANSSDPPPSNTTGKQPVVSSVPVSQNGSDGVFINSATTNTNGKTQGDDNNEDNENGRKEERTVQDAYYQASEEMRRWKQARDLFVKRGGQGDLAEVLRSQSRAGREEDEEEEQQEQQTYVREYSPPPRLPTL